MGRIRTKTYFTEKFFEEGMMVVADDSNNLAASADVQTEPVQDDDEPERLEKLYSVSSHHI